MTLQLPAYDGDPATLQFILDQIAMAMPDNALGAYPVVAALPTGVPNGIVVHYLADATNGVVWALKYRAASTSPYKWEYIGGASLYNFAAADSPNASIAANSAYASTGLTLTLPLAGDYDIENGGYGFASVVVANKLSYAVGGAVTTASDTDAVDSDGTTGASVANVRRKTATAAGTVVTQAYRNGSGAASTLHWLNRFLRATPVRVG